VISREVETRSEVVTLVRRSSRGKLRRVDAPEGKDIVLFLELSRERYMVFGRWTGNAESRSAERDDHFGGNLRKAGRRAGFGWSLEETVMSRKPGGPHDW
jgi:hypothetical protein